MHWSHFWTLRRATHSVLETGKRCGLSPQFKHQKLRTRRRNVFFVSAETEKQRLEIKSNNDPIRDEKKYAEKHKRLSQVMDMLFHSLDVLDKRAENKPDEEPKEVTNSRKKTREARKSLRQLEGILKEVTEHGRHDIEEALLKLEKAALKVTGATAHEGGILHDVGVSVVKECAKNTDALDQVLHMGIYDAGIEVVKECAKNTEKIDHLTDTVRSEITHVFADMTARQAEDVLQLARNTRHAEDALRREEDSQHMNPLRKLISGASDMRNRALQFFGASPQQCDGASYQETRDRNERKRRQEALDEWEKEARVITESDLLTEALREWHAEEAQAKSTEEMEKDGSIHGYRKAMDLRKEEEAQLLKKISDLKRDDNMIGY